MELSRRKPFADLGQDALRLCAKPRYSTKCILRARLMVTNDDKITRLRELDLIEKNEMDYRACMRT
jgi:hypothetical protein